MANGFEGIGKNTGRGHNTHTISGNVFFPTSPEPKEIHIADIAHSLSMLTRFNGHCRWFYSVAQHCVIMSNAVSPEYALEALMHDAAEAYIGDLVRPVKAHCPDWCEIDKRLDAVIRAKFGLPEAMSAEVRHWDNVMCATEKRDLLNPSMADWAGLPEPAPFRIEPWPQEYAKYRFLERYNELTGQL